MKCSVNWTVYYTVHNILFNLQSGSLGCYNIPIYVAGNRIVIEIDVVSSDLPLLLSLKCMKMLKMKLNLEKDTVEIFGKEIVLNNTTSGHYCLSLSDDIQCESVFNVKLYNLDVENRRKVFVNLIRGTLFEWKILVNLPVQTFCFFF